ncbi:aryl-sulfate sulfotransferase [Aureliella helgolandensis]|nr:aryl-sulfate sulfotransferase [Aureliella helgolandensis]
MQVDVADLFVGQPTIRGNPIERVPLVAIVDLESPVEVVPSLEISDGDRVWIQPWPVKPATKHRVAVMGMRPNRSHTIRVRVDAADSVQEQWSEPLFFQTPPLPDNFPPISVVHAEPQRMEPGVTFFATNIWKDSISILDYGYIVALDAEGQVVWFCETTDRIADMRILKNGHILYQHGNYRYAYEIDILGRDINRWVATNLTELPDSGSIPVGIDTTHHDILELPNGNFLTLATVLKHFEEFPTSELDPEAPWAAAHVVCDDIVEFNPRTGVIVKRFPLSSVLDNKRLGYMSLGSFWKDKYNDEEGNVISRDWSHANGLTYLPDESALLISFRHQDCVMKLDWKTHEIRWIFGNPEGWADVWQQYMLKPVGELAWCYHQHAPQWTPRGTLMLYDNGNYRARPFQQPMQAYENQSRVVEFRIDEEAMTVEQVFEYSGGEDDPFYSPFYCEADWLPNTQNILVTDGGHVELSDGTPSDNVPGERQWARIFELTRDAQPERVFEIQIDSGMESPFGWSVYRAMRLPNLIDGFRIDPLAVDEPVPRFERDPHEKREVLH